jgi:hypothetical protein
MIILPDMENRTLFSIALAIFLAFSFGSATAQEDTLDGFVSKSPGVAYYYGYAIKDHGNKKTMYYTEIIAVAIDSTPKNEYVNDQWKDHFSNTLGPHSYETRICGPFQTVEEALRDRHRLVKPNDLQEPKPGKEKDEFMITSFEYREKSRDKEEKEEKGEGKKEDK